MPQRKRKPTPQEPSGLSVLILVFGVMIALALLVRLVTGLISSPVKLQEDPQMTVTEPAPEETEEKQSLWDRLFGGKKEEENDPDPTETTPQETRPQIVSTATVGTMGDMLMHIQLFDAKHNAISNLGGGNYDFSPVFEYVADAVSELDYAIANLETTFGGDNYPYQGNPTFNCPDPLAKALADAGYDMMLTANNHCSDTLMPGIKRTLNVVRNAGMETLGTRLTGDEKRYSIVEVNGIRIGMVCYTYTMKMVEGVPSLNGGWPLDEPELVNWFTYDDLEGFYQEIGGVYSDMKAAGAEAAMLFIHWGDEYQLTENTWQNTIAQKMCDLGFDVIVGGHPHVVQPMELLESTVDPEQKTVCIYSLGNSVSNQRLGNLKSIQTAHTEDGALFTVTFEKWSDGHVRVSGTDVLPLWVTMHEATGKLEYNILPLDKLAEDTWAQQFGLSPETQKAAQASWQRTMDIVGGGLQECLLWLNDANENREDPAAAQAAEQGG